MENVPDYLHRYIEKDLIAVQRHPEFPLIVCNYTNNTQYSKAWDYITLTHRGLVLHAETSEVISHCLPKFFNYEEHQAFDWLEDIPLYENYEVYEKLDGSYISVRNHPEFGLIVASRGSFTSDHAAWAREIIDERGWSFDPEYTYIFELIHPDNRIVVNYGDTRDLILLDVLDKDGNTIVFDWMDRERLSKDGFTLVRTLDVDTIDELLEQDLPADEFEGYVVKYAMPDGDLRVKVKLQEYARVHSLVYGMSKNEIIRYARESNIDEILSQIPDTGFEWIKDAVEGASWYARTLDGSSTVIADMARAMDADAQTEYETIMSVDGVSREIKNLAVAKLRNNHADKIEDSIWKYVRQWTRDKTILEIASYGNGRNREE